MADKGPHFDEAVAIARAELVEDAPSSCHVLDDTHFFHVVRLHMRARVVGFRVLPAAVERIVGFRVFLEPEGVVVVTSLVADMRERVRDPFDIAKWITPKNYVVHDLGLISWLFPLEVTLERRSAEPVVVDFVVVTEASTDAGTLP